MVFNKFAAWAALIAATTAIMWGCKVSYSFTGGSIDEAAMTFSVAHIPNNAQYVSPALSNDFTTALTERSDKRACLRSPRVATSATKARSRDGPTPRLSSRATTQALGRAR